MFFVKLFHLIEEGEAKLFIEPAAEMFLIGTTIDFESEDFEKGRFENKFTFTPDKDLATSCGCYRRKICFSKRKRRFGNQGFKHGHLYSCKNIFSTL